MVPSDPSRGERFFRVNGAMDAAEALPPLPPGWRDEAVTMLFEFLEDAGLASTLDALEKETGCVPGRALSAPAFTDLRASSAILVPLVVHRTRPLRDFADVLRR